MSMPINDESLLEVVARSLDVPREGLSLESSRDSLPTWDSMGHILLMLAVEKQFGRKIRFEVIERIRSVRDLQEALNGE